MWWTQRKQEEKSEPVKVVPKKPPAKIEGKNTGEWKLTITAKENCTTEEWIDLVKSSVAIQLEMASSESDVTNIFRVNREIFDKMKELDADQYQALVNDFKIRKDKFKE
jgi:hypothetical protein